VEKIIKDFKLIQNQSKMLAVDKKNLSFKHPFTCVTAGPASSG
jgi:hypothetical protein